MSDENNIFEEEEKQTTQSTFGTENKEKQTNTQGDYQQNDYQQNSYGQYQQNPYGQYQQTTASGKKMGQGFGIASLVLGIVSLVMFCTCINIIIAIVAIVFGIIQIVRYEKKGMAIGGIATAGTSILLFFICMGLLFSNANFIRMIEREIYTEEITDSDDIEDWKRIIEEYSNGEYSVDIEGNDEDGSYKIQVTPNENGESDVHIETDGDTL